MSIRAHIRRALTDPRTVVWERRDPRQLFDRYGRLARAAGLEELFLVLSFDCDTFEDAAVAWGVHERLLAIGVNPTYAVPGEILEQGSDVYGRIAQTGAEFMNHGYREHTILRDGVYTSTLFYDQISPNEVRADIVAGDRAVTEVTGRRPSGFRTPHFGTYGKPAHLHHLHSVLAELGYLYSSSTVPLWGFRRGPAFDDMGVLELPVSGTASAPLEILDSWGCFAARDRSRVPADYGIEGEAVLKLYERAGAGILSFYADPSQIHDQDVFFETVEGWATAARPSSYGEIAAQLTSRSVAA